MNKSIEHFAKRLIDEDGNDMVSWENCYSDYGVFGEGTVSHWLVLKSEYEWQSTGTSCLHEQLRDICNLIKDDKIYKLHTAAGLAVVGDYILGEDGKPKNFNPFSNGTYRRRK